MFLLSTACSVSANLPAEALTALRLQIEGEGVGVGGCLGKMSHSIEIVMRVMCLILSALLLLREFGFLPSPALPVMGRARCISSVILGMRKR